MTYIDANGIEQTENNATKITSSITSLSNGWYYVNEDVTINENIYLSGNGTVHLILCDGATLNASTITSSYNDTASLVIYGQSEGTGTVNLSKTSVTINGGKVNITGSNTRAAIWGRGNGGVTINGGEVNITGTGVWASISTNSTSSGSITINNGKVSINSSATDKAAYIQSYKGSVTINGGQVTVTAAGNATGTMSGITCGSNGTITLGYKNANDYINSPGYYKNSKTPTTPTIIDGQTFCNDSNNNETFSGTVSASSLDGKKLVPLKYTIDFNANGGTGTMASIKVPYNVAQTLTENKFTPPSGKRFKGWNTAQNGTGTSYADKATNVTFTANTTLYAQWEDDNYTVTFDANGHGTAPNTQTVNYGGKVTKPTDLTATGYTFGGWYKEAVCTNAWNLTATL